MVYYVQADASVFGLFVAAYRRAAGCYHLAGVQVDARLHVHRVHFDRRAAHFQTY